MDLLTEFCKSPDARCPRCGYSLTGLTRGVCPECGAPLRLALTLGGPPRWSVALSVGLLALLAIYSAAGGLRTWIRPADPGFVVGGWVGVPSVVLAVACIGVATWAIQRARDPARAARRIVLVALACGVLHALQHASWMLWLWLW